MNWALSWYSHLIDGDGSEDGDCGGDDDGDDGEMGRWLVNLSRGQCYEATLATAPPRLRPLGENNISSDSTEIFDFHDIKPLIFT